jgi:hypothetical protein
MFKRSLYIHILTLCLLLPLRPLAADPLDDDLLFSEPAITQSAFQDSFPDSIAVADFMSPQATPPQRVSDPDTLYSPEDESIILFTDTLLQHYRFPDTMKALITASTRRGLQTGDSLITYQPPQNAFGSDSLRFFVSIGEFRDTLMQYLEILPVNDAPKWKKPLFRPLEFPEDEILRIEKSWLHERATDPETPDSSLYYHAHAGRHVHVSLEGAQMILVADENWFGRDTLMLRVSDGELADTALLPVVVTPVNDPPVLHPLPDIVINEDDTLFLERSTLEKFAEDIETPREDLKWQATRLGKIRAFYDGEKIRITAPPNWFGEDSIRLTVSDGELADHRIWKIRFLPVNDPPRWLRTPQRSIFEDDTLFLAKRDLYRMVRDPETEPADLEWTLIPGDKLQILEQEKGYEIFAPPNWHGRSHVHMIISDGEYRDSTSMSLRVISVNDPPVLGTIPPKSWNEDDTLTLSYHYLNTYASDVETKSEDLLWSFIAEPPLFVSDDKTAVKFTAAPDWNGSGIITAVISDGGLRDSTDIAVTVHPVNDAPRWSALPDTSMLEDKPMTLLLSFLREFVHDPDKGDSITLDISAGEHLYIEEKGDSLILWPEQDWYGTETLLLKAGDGKTSSSVKWKIPVRPVNDPPYFTVSLPDSLSFPANRADTLNMRDIVYDIDNDFSELSWEITPGRIVRYLFHDEEDKIIFFTEGYKHGDDAVTIRVTDGHDMIVYYMPVYVHEVDRFLVANPDKLELLPNSPNPFREYTDIRYSLPVACHVSIRIYDLLGKEIKELVNQYHEAANYSQRWYGENENNRPVPSGVYLCRMDALVDGEPRVLMRKMMLVR